MEHSRERDSQQSWLLTESALPLAVPQHGQGRRIQRPYLSSSSPSAEPRRHLRLLGRRGRDAALLARLWRASPDPQGQDGAGGAYQPAQNYPLISPSGEAASTVPATIPHKSSQTPANLTLLRYNSCTAVINLKSCQHKSQIAYSNSL